MSEWHYERLYSVEVFKRKSEKLIKELKITVPLRRTDDAVFNIPGFGKNYLQTRQHRDLLSILP